MFDKKNGFSLRWWIVKKEWEREREINKEEKEERKDGSKWVDERRKEREEDTILIFSKCWFSILCFWPIEGGISH